MLEKVSAINYKRCYPKRLKGFFQSSLNYKTYRDFVPYTENAVVGNIPSEIINLFAPAERKMKIKSFQSVLAETAQACRDEKNLEELHEVLNSGLKDIMPEGTRAYINFAGDGSFKEVWRLTFIDKNGKKIMHDKAFQVYNMRNDIYPRVSHGLWAEPNSWIYLQSNIGHSVEHSQFTRHYISDLKNGYSMTEFVDDTISETKKDFDHNRLLGVYLSDSHMNHRKNNKVYDIGGLLRDKTFPKDRTTIKFFKKIANRNTAKEREEVVQNLTRKAENPRTPLRRNILAALDFYNSLPPWYWEKTSERIPMRMLG